MPARSPRVELTSGRVRGHDGAYLGMADAAPPGGEPRWILPSPLPSRAEELGALAAGPPPPGARAPGVALRWGRGAAGARRLPLHERLDPQWAMGHGLFRVVDRRRLEDRWIGWGTDDGVLLALPSMTSMPPPHAGRSAQRGLV